MVSLGVLSESVAELIIPLCRFVAEQSGAKKLALFHHDPEHTDKFLFRMEKECQKRFPEAFLAREGMEIDA